MTKKIYEIRIWCTEWNNDDDLRGWTTLAETKDEEFAYWIRERVQDYCKMASNEVEVRVRDVDE